MKSIITKWTLSVSVTLFALTAFAQATKDTVTVWGNCGMCKTRIEKAAKQAGATAASWNEDSKVLAVSYNASKSSLKKIQEKVAAVGHDTRDFTAPQNVYDNLHGCCQYDRKGGTSASMMDSDKKCCASKDCGTGKDCCKEGVACCTDKACCTKAGDQQFAKKCCASKDCGTGKDCCKEGTACCTDKACCAKSAAAKDNKCCANESCTKGSDCCKDGKTTCANKACCSK
jgi:hypothetical protein